jgi:type II secretory pathway component PulJ
MKTEFVLARRRQAGASLLEVLVALSLLATAMLGAAAAQLEALRSAEGQAQREEALWIGASLAEAMHFSEAAVGSTVRAQTRAIARLQGARIEVRDEADGVGVVLVHWAHRRIASSPRQAPAVSPCAAGEEAALMRCLAFPFVRGK